MEQYQIEQRIEIDFTNTGVPPRVLAKQYDSNTRVVAADLYNGGRPYTVPPGYEVNIRLDKRDGHYVYNPALFGTGNTVFVILTQQMLTSPGELLAELEVVQEENVLKTATFIIDCHPSTVPERAIQSGDEFKTVQEILDLVRESAKVVTENLDDIHAIPGQMEDISDLVEQAEAAKAGAETARDAAAGSATEADVSKVEAEKVLEGTQSIEQAIQMLAEKARQYAELAQQYAELASQIAYGQKGYYPTPDDLRAAYPTGEDGWWAVVGTTDTIWVWDSDSGAWVDSRQGTDMSNYPQWAQLSNKLLVPCTCLYDAATHTFSITRKDVSQQLADGAELTFRPPVDYTRGDTVEFEGAEIPVEYAGSPVDIQTGAWLAGRPAKLIWYSDEEGGSQNALRSRRRTRT